jgi:RNA-directed DNA polymerase
MSLCDALLAPEVLAGAYARLGRRPGLWAPGVPMSKVRMAPVGPMLRLAEELRQGRYLALPPTQVPIAKADGTQRMLSVFGLRDRLVQRALLDIVQPVSEPRFHDASFGFRPGRGVAKAVTQAQLLVDTGYRWLVDADIRRCFDSIPRRPLLDAVGCFLDDADAPMLVARCLGWQNEGLARDARGIPQGACLSPWLCNVFLHRFDEESARSEVPLVRYADDFLLFATARSAAMTLMKRCGRWLSILGLRLHPDKSRVVDAREPVRFLGKVVQAC